MGRKKIFKIALVGAMALVLCTSLSTTIHASATKTVVKSYKMDINKYTPERTFFDYVYIDVSSTYVCYSETKEKIGEAWNYNRFLVTKYYKDHQSII